MHSVETRGRAFEVFVIWRQSGFGLRCAWIKLYL